MSEIRDELDPPFEIIEPADYAAGRCCSIRRIAARSIRASSSPPRGSISPTLRRSEDSFVDELIAGVVSARLPADAGAFSALLSST